MEHRTRAPVRASNFASWNGGQRAPVHCGGYYTRLWDLTYALGLLAPYGALCSLMITERAHVRDTYVHVVRVPSDGRVFYYFTSPHPESSYKVF